MREGAWQVVNSQAEHLGVTLDYLLRLRWAGCQERLLSTGFQGLPFIFRCGDLRTLGSNVWSEEPSGDSVESG